MPNVVFMTIEMNAIETYISALLTLAFSDRLEKSLCDKIKTIKTNSSSAIKGKVNLWKYNNCVVTDVDSAMTSMIQAYLMRLKRLYDNKTINKPTINVKI